MLIISIDVSHKMWYYIGGERKKGVLPMHSEEPIGQTEGSPYMRKT